MVIFSKLLLQQRIYCAHNGNNNHNNNTCLENVGLLGKQLNHLPAKPVLVMMMVVEGGTESLKLHAQHIFHILLLYQISILDMKIAASYSFAFLLPAVLWALCRL